MISLIDNINSNISGLPITYAWRGHGSAIFIEIGKLSHRKRKNHPKGEFSVMLDCEWRIENDQSIEYGSYCEKGIIEEMLMGLMGDDIAHIETLGCLHELVIVLRSGKRIVSFTNDIGDPEWCVFLGNGKYLGVRDGVVVSENA
ncbi:hypothetical protein GPAL_0381 [Glaciecola pallidula DSM 14239 = ACAM 615]|uniref:Uncharacterized protein n=2 Tax=Brumicola TaxID=3160924 RepID=K6YTH7_9ALTE|nr:hypothetical protein GPAL_0381 [Glaciecola pallidula DSM 14239 = ACAM 615]